MNCLKFDNVFIPDIWDGLTFYSNKGQILAYWGFMVDVKSYYYDVEG